MEEGISVVIKSKVPRRNPAMEDREKNKIKSWVMKRSEAEKSKKDYIGAKMKVSEEIKKE